MRLPCNPSLILKAFELPGYQDLIDEVLATSRGKGENIGNCVSRVVDRLAVAMGSKIAKAVSGRVSTEVAARLSFDTQASIRKAHELIDLYGRHGVGRDRILIKLAATWEGIRAAEVLERVGIQCNLTLLFSDAQAQACFDAGVFLVSPFVGRVSDWHKQKAGNEYLPGEDPGVRFVRSVCERAAAGGYGTIVMGASFRTTGQVLAGCPRLTISPALLEELAASEGGITPSISQGHAEESRPQPLSEAEFRWGHNEDAMATEKLAEGILRFADDQRKLESLITKRLTTQ